MNLLKVWKIHIVMYTVLSKWSCASELRCYSCDNVESNESCNRVIRCPTGAIGCKNVVRIENGILRISKGCQQFSTCLISSRQNYQQCHSSVQTAAHQNVMANAALSPSVCRSCCDTDLCNSKPFLQEQTRGGRRQGNIMVSSQPAQPFIKDLSILLIASDTILVTLLDTTSRFEQNFNIRIIPEKSAIITRVLANDRHLHPTLSGQVLAAESLTYLIRGLSGGNLYRIGIISRERQAFSTQSVFKSFMTKPRPPSSLRMISVGTDSLSVFVGISPPGNGNRLSYYSLSYRKYNDSLSEERTIPNFKRHGLRVISNLMPSMKYIISVWTSAIGPSETLRASSNKVNLNVFTAVPGVNNVALSEIHATNITWIFRVSENFVNQSQENFEIVINDVTNNRIAASTILGSDQRSFTITDLTPRTTYTFSIKASAAGRYSETITSDPVTTLLRCYSCYEVENREDCNQYIECLPNEEGCLNEVRLRTFTNTDQHLPSMHRATLKCKQMKSCDNNEKQNLTLQCNPDRNRNIDPPDVCRCCCEGDLCNGPGSICGDILDWLDPLHIPIIPSALPALYCSELNLITNGEVFCTHDREVGSSCSFLCDEGFYLSGTKRTTCLENGEWSHDVPECNSNRCTEFELIEGRIINCSDGSQIGSVCKFSCEYGFVLVGDAIIYCDASGEWNEVSIPVCLQQVSCELLVAPAHGYIQCTDQNYYGSRCRYRCEEGYEQHGSTYVRCLADGLWSSLEPTLCLMKSCSVPAQKLINGGVTNCSGFQFGDTCQFSCPTGLVVAGGPDSITCRADNTWTDNIPCCDLQCPPHALIDLFLLLDSSSSVGRTNWNILINFTIALLEQFVVGPHDMKVGVGRYHQVFDTDHEILLGDYEDFSDLKRKLRTIPYKGYGTLTGKALWHMYNVSLKSPGNRPDVRDVVVLITDGFATDDIITPSIFIKQQDVKMYVVGVKNRFSRMNYRQLSRVSSGPHYFKIITDGYNSLARDLSRKLTDDVCWLPCEFKYKKRELLLRKRLLAAMKDEGLDNVYWKKNNNLTRVPSH